MTQEALKLNELATSIFADNAAKGFWEATQMVNSAPLMPGSLLDDIQRAFKAQKLALITSEISEALEADRKDLMDDKLTHRKGLEVELADAMIRILDMAGGYQMDIEGAVYEKLAYNRSREHMHGKKF